MTGEPRPVGRLRVAVTVLLLLGTLAAVTVAGCIRRYPAPAAPAPSTMPYSAIASWLRVELPPAPAEDRALPAAALRLAVFEDGKVFADSAGVDGREATRVAEDWDAALELVGAGEQPVVLLAGVGVLDPAQCAALAGLGDRLHVAAGTSGYADEGPERRPAADGFSRDPLAAAPLSLLCPSTD